VTASFQYDGLDRLVAQSNQSLVDPATLSSRDSSTVAATPTKTTYAYAYQASSASLRTERRQYVGSLTQADAVTYAWTNPFGELWYVSDQAVAGGSLVFATSDGQFTYDAAGRLARADRYTDWNAAAGGIRNWVQTQYAYDGAGRLASLTHQSQRRTTPTWPGFTLLVGFGYQYDLAGRISRIDTDWNTSLPAFSSRTDETQDFTYDNAGQLTDVESNLSAGGTGDAAYDYGPNGNRTTATEPGNYPHTYTTGSQNRVAQDGEWDFQYDAEGNLTRRTSRFDASHYVTYTWDHRNRLTKIEHHASGAVSQTIDHRYNAAGGLVRESVDNYEGLGAAIKQYVNEGGRRAITLDGGGASATVARRYQYGPTGEVLFDQFFEALGQETERYELLGDHQHTTRAVLGHSAIDNATFVVQSYDYAPFGLPSRVLNDFGGYTAHSAPIVHLFHGLIIGHGVYFTQTRVYDPYLGRFLSQDPSGFAGGDANLYRFAGNDPITTRDDTGLSQSGHPLSGYSTLAGPQLGLYAAPSRTSGASSLAVAPRPTARSSPTRGITVRDLDRAAALGSGLSTSPGGLSSVPIPGQPAPISPELRGALWVAEARRSAANAVRREEARELKAWQNYGSGVVDVFQGYGDAVVGTVQGAYNVVRHPINTTYGIATAIRHPILTGQAIFDQISEQSQTLRGQGQIVGDILTGIATGGALKTASKTKLVQDAAAAAARAAKTTGRYLDDLARTVQFDTSTLSSGGLGGIRLRANSPSSSSLVIDRYGTLRQSPLPGQAHHLNQAAAYSDVIPFQEGASIKLQGNIFTDVGAPHTRAHQSLEGFWNQYRGTDIVPTNLQYTRALQQSLRASGLPESQVQQAVRAAIQERLQYGQLGGSEVPRIPNPIPNLAR
jgi:RHS repeat-associated protein